MKRVFLFALLVCCLLLAACDSGSKDGDGMVNTDSSDAATVAAASDKPELEGLSMAFRSLDTTGETPRVTVDWTNNSGKNELTFGEAFNLYKKVGTGWEVLPMKEDWGFTSIGLLCTGTQEHTYDLGAYLDTLEPGALYRIEAYAIEEYPTTYYFSTTFRAE